MSAADERLALVTLRTALDAVRLARSACVAADFGHVHVLAPLERIAADLAAVVAVVADGAPITTEPSRYERQRTIGKRA